MTTNITLTLHRECRLLRRLANELLDGYNSDNGWGVTLEPHMTYEGEAELDLDAIVYIKLRQPRTFEEITKAELILQNVVEHIRRVEIRCCEGDIPV